jgi:hypothetical protein
MAAAARQRGGAARWSAALCALAAALLAARPAAARVHTLAQLPLTHIVTDPLARGACAGGTRPAAMRSA